MKKLKLLCMLLLLSGVACGQSVVSEAKAKLEKQHHDSMVHKAQTLLEYKASLEADLATVNAKLTKLEAGQDVKVMEAAEIADGVVSMYPNGYACSCSTCCMTVHSGN